MRIPFSLSSVLTAVTIAIVVLVLPSAIRRVVQSGDPFTERFFADMWARLTDTGPIHPAANGGDSNGCARRQARSTNKISSLSLFARLSAGAQAQAIATCDCLGRDLVAIAIILDLIAQASII